MEEYRIFQYFTNGLYYIGFFINGVLQWDLYGPYKKLSTAKMIATKHGIKIE